MLEWVCVVTKLDTIRNERIRGTNNVGEMDVSGREGKKPETERQHLDREALWVEEAKQ